MYHGVQVQVQFISATNPRLAMNELNMYLNPRIHGLIPTEGKNSIREGGREDREEER
jgi:hypothetical protein